MDPDESPLKQIRTFQGDVAEALNKQKESLVSIQRQEHEKRGPVTSIDQTFSKKTPGTRNFFLLFLGSLVLLVLAVIGVGFIYNEFVLKTALPTITIPANRFLSINSEVDVSMETLARGSLINTLTSAVRNVERGEIEHLVIKKSEEGNPLLTTNELFKGLESRAPGSLVRSLDPLFMLGVLGRAPEGGGSSIFLIIRLASFENAYAGMLAWEENMAQDIGALFATAELLRNLPPETTFIDVTDRNKDLRMLSLEDRPVLLYSFFDNNKLIITDSLETLRTLIDRLTREKLSR
jgi:hypothetical protein